MAGETKGTVLVALGANVGVAAAKFAGAILTASPALFAQAAQSVSDVVNQLLLLTSLSRSRRPADRRHPFGYGKERFFWSFLAAVGILVTGAGFSGIEAYRAFTSQEPLGQHYFLVAYALLAFVLLAEGTSWVRALRQVRGQARRAGRGLASHVRASSDPSVKTVVAEDSAAVIGVLLAAGGIALHQATGAGWWEGVSAAAIAVLLVATALVLGRDTKDLLIGEAVDEDVSREMREFLARWEGVDDVLDLLTMKMGTEDLLVAARVDLDSGLSSDDVEDVSTDIDRAIRQRWPEATQVFLDATRAGGGRGKGSAPRSS